MTHETDLLIFGGGVAGLFLLNRFVREGRDCLLLEQGSLGGAQTLHSQGIIHGGLKYALGGALNAEADAIKEMPDRWRRMLAGQDSVDLRGTQVLSDTQYMWSQGSLAARFTTFAASRMLRGRIDTVEGDDRPAAFRHARFRGTVYRLNDLVIDTPSLLRTLLAPVANRALAIDSGTPSFSTARDGAGVVVSVTLRDGEAITIAARHVVFAAGAGNEGLCNAAGVTAAPMQRRPLHMVMLKTPGSDGLYAHCIGTGSKPRLTVTTHPVEDGQVWYLGGDIAEQGVERDEAQQRDAARKEVAELLPWIDTRHARWACLRIDRAEPRQAALVKPDCASATAQGPYIVTWPTKLTLAPDLGDRVAGLLGPATAPFSTPPETWPLARPGRPTWEACF